MEIDLNSPMGNAFNIMSVVKSYLKQTDRRDEWPEISKKMMSSNYENLCEIAVKTTHGFIKFVDDRELGGEEYDY